VVVMAMLWASTGLSRASAWMPQLVLGFTLLLLVLQLYRDFRTSSFPGVAEADGEQAGKPGSGAGRLLGALGWFLLLLLLIVLCGVAVGGALFCAAWLRWHARENRLFSGLVAACLGLAMWGLFVVLLGLGLYPGVVWPALG